MASIEISKTIDEIVAKVREEYDSFVFETVAPYCEKVTKTEITKADLVEALTVWKSFKEGASERKTECNDEDIYSVLASIKTECKQRESCEGCRFRDGTETCNCNIWGVPSVWTVETKGAEE